MNQLKLTDEQIKELREETSHPDLRILSLCREVLQLRRWKAEAMELLIGYDKIAELAPGKLGSSKVANLEAYVKRLRGDKA